MTFDEVLTQTLTLLQQQGRLSYRALKRRLDLDDEYLEDLKAELIDARQVAVDEGGKVLVWTGDKSRSTSPKSERRQITVMFCDMVGSTALSARIDPEDLHDRVRAYQQVCGNVIRAEEGHIAQYLGDGILVYFGYPVAFEDDAPRAVRAGLNIVEAIQESQTLNKDYESPVQVRIGIHTGPVVLGEIGGDEHHETLALGETPNVAARIQGKAGLNEIVISAATRNVVGGFFEYETLGLQDLKGIPKPIELYRVIREDLLQNRFDAATQAGLTPFVGRETEFDKLRSAWAKAQLGDGQIVLLRGEPGIGKSRLVREFRAYLDDTEATQIEISCSRIHSNSPLFPVREYLGRALEFHRDDSPEAKVHKLERALSRHRFPQADTAALLASLLHLPFTEPGPATELSPEQQRQRTLDALVGWFIEISGSQPCYCIWEDLHVADASTLELLHHLLDKIPGIRALVLAVSRPEFDPPWVSYRNLHSISLNRLDANQIENMALAITQNKTLPPELTQHIKSKTDGVPLFVEELTKMVIEAEFVRLIGDHYELAKEFTALTIPVTLHDSLMARLDRLPQGKEVAQLGAAVGREFSNDLLLALINENVLREGVRQLLNADLVFRSQLPPNASYVFKHALIQDTAYDSMLRSERRVHHARIAGAIEERYPETRTLQPEVLAHHCTAANLAARAIPYWQSAGNMAIARSANTEARNYLVKGLELLKTTPNTLARANQEMDLQTTLGPVIIAIKGNADPEVEMRYASARYLCEKLDRTDQLFPILFGLRSYYLAKADLATAHTLSRQLLDIAQKTQDSDQQLEAHVALSNTHFFYGNFPSVETHAEQGIRIYDEGRHRDHVRVYGLDPGVICVSRASQSKWHRGFPDQAVRIMEQAVMLAENRAHPFTLAYLLDNVAVLHQWRHDAAASRKWAEAAIDVSSEHEFPFFKAWGMVQLGRALIELGHESEGEAQLMTGLSTADSIGVLLMQPWFLATLAEAQTLLGKIDEGLATVADALAVIEHTGATYAEPMLLGLKGELLQRFDSGASLEQARETLESALRTARAHDSRSFELRTAISTARLLRRQAKLDDARSLLAGIYDKFSEGFDTKDLKDAKALLEELG